MKGARALAGGMLVLASICVPPAVSAAQDSGSLDQTTTATTADPAAPQVDPANAPTGPADAGQPTQEGPTTEAPPPAPPAPTPPEPEVAVSNSSSSGRAHASASASVTIADFFFSPASVTVAVGDTVTWHNTGQAPHNATADDGSFKTPDLNQGQSASHTFTSAGTFSYICTIHPNMKGTVRVVSSSGGGGASGGGTAGSSSSGSANSEASAVASPNAAGNSNTLPMTGMAVGGLAVVGFALLALGLLARWADGRRSGRRSLTIF